MKLRVLTATNKGKLLALAEMISKKGQSDYAVDVIPPAYSCERERLVVIVATVGGKMKNSFEIFCKDLNRGRAQHVALLIDGTPENAAPVIEWIKGAGANLYDEVLYMNGGMPFKFMRKASDEEQKTALDWFDKVLEWMNNN